jgi:transposase
MRQGADFFRNPSGPAQRRYEALRAYLLEGASAEAVGQRFGYSKPTLYQLAAELRAGKARFFLSSKPGPKGPHKAAGVRDRVLALRAEDRSVTEIAAVLRVEGTPVSYQTVWSILKAEGFERLPLRAAQERGRPPRIEPVKAQALPTWPVGASFNSDHAGLFLLLPAMARLELDRCVAAADYPGTRVLSSWHSLSSLLITKLLRRSRVSHVEDLAPDLALGLASGLTAIPKATHLTSYSYRVRRTSNQALLAAIAGRMRELGVVTGEAGFNLDFHAIRHHGQEAPLDDNYVPSRSQSTRSVLTFFAQDHTSTEMVYANADVTREESAREVIAFAEYWRRVSGADPGLLVFDSRLTTHPVLDELSGRGLLWMTLRQRGRKVLEELARLPDSAWKTARIERAGRYRSPQLHDQVIAIKGLANRVRQIAVRNIGRDQPTLLLTNDLSSPLKALFTRYAGGMLIENELDAYISGFHLNALSSGLALNVDLDTTLTVAAGNIYRLFARDLPRYEAATPDRLYRHFIDAPGRVSVNAKDVVVSLGVRTYTPVLLAAGYGDLEVPIPWWEGRRLRFSFPPR